MKIKLIYNNISLGSEKVMYLSACTERPQSSHLAREKPDKTSGSMVTSGTAGQGVLFGVTKLLTQDNFNSLCQL